MLSTLPANEEITSRDARALPCEACVRFEVPVFSSFSFSLFRSSSTVIKRGDRIMVSSSASRNSVRKVTCERKKVERGERVGARERVARSSLVAECPEEWDAVNKLEDRPGKSTDNARPKFTPSFLRELLADLLRYREKCAAYIILRLASNEKEREWRCSERDDRR